MALKVLVYGQTDKYANFTAAISSAFNVVCASQSLQATDVLFSNMDFSAIFCIFDDMADDISDFIKNVHVQPELHTIPVFAFLESNDEMLKKSAIKSGAVGCYSVNISENDIGCIENIINSFSEKFCVNFDDLQPEKEIRLAKDSLPCGIMRFYIDKKCGNFRLLSINCSALTLFGYDDIDDLIRDQKNPLFFDSRIPGDSELFVKSLKKSALLDSTLTLEQHIVTKTGTEKYLRMLMCRAKENKKIVECIFIDDTDMHRSNINKYCSALICAYDMIYEIDSVLGKCTLQSSDIPGVCVGKVMTLDYFVNYICEKTTNPEDISKIKWLFDISRKRGTVESLEINMQLNDKLLFFTVTVLCVEKTSMLVGVKDITKQKQEEMQRHNDIIDEMKKISELFDEVMLNNPGGFAVFEAKEPLEPLFISDNTKKMFDGIPSEKNFRIFDKNPKHRLPVTHQQVMDTFKSGQVLDVPEIKLLKNNGKYFWAHVTAHLVKKSDELYVLYMTFTDITIQQEVKKERDAALSQANALIANTPGGVVEFCCDNGGKSKAIYISDGFCKLLGYSFEQLGKNFGNDIFALIFENDAKDFVNMVNSALKLCNGFDSQCRMIHKDGTILWISVKCNAVRDRNEKTVLYASFSDITSLVEKKRNDEWQEQRYRLLSEACSSITFDYLPENDQMHFSFHDNNKSNVKEVHETVIDNYLLNFQCNTTVHPDNRENCIAAFRRCMESANEGTIEIRSDYYKSGYEWFRVTYVSVADESDKVFRIVGRIDNIDKIVKDRMLDGDKVIIDGVSGLRSKDSANDAVHLIMKQRQPDRVDAVLFFDVDNFKLINDTLGHYEGDIILNKVGTFLKSLFRHDDIISRFGGDEFLIYIGSIGDISLAVKKAKCILDFFSSIECDKIGNLHCSIGIVEINSNKYSFEQIFKMADYALYVSKRAGKNQYTLYNPETMGSKISDI